MIHRAGRTVPRTLIAAGALLLISGVTTSCADQTVIDGELAGFPLSGSELVIDSDNSRIELVPDENLTGEIAVTRWFKVSKISGETSTDWSMTDDGTLELRTICRPHQSLRGPARNQGAGRCHGARREPERRRGSRRLRHRADPQQP